MGDVASLGFGESVAVVTGGSGGVGAALCATLARRGVHVLALGRDAERLEACRRPDPARIQALRADLTSEAERARVVEFVAERGPIRYLVHAAASVTPVVRAEALREDEWRAAQALNVEAPLFLSLRLLPYFAAGGRILHVSSGAAHVPVAGCLSYCASKSALHLIYKVLQLELAERDVQVGSASPGSVDTPMQAALRDASAHDFPEAARFRELAARGQLLSPERSATFLAWLLLEAPDSLFGERDWNIQDGELRSRWEGFA